VSSPLLRRLTLVVNSMMLAFGAVAMVSLHLTMKIKKPMNQYNMGSLLHDPLWMVGQRRNPCALYVPQVVGAFGMNFATWMSEQSAEVSKVRHLFPPLHI